MAQLANGRTRRLAVRLLLTASMAAGALQPARAQRTSVVYTDRADGFTFTLPASWKGFSVIPSTNKLGPGLPATADSLAPKPDPRIPLKFRVITLRDPRWTKTHPRQDIPIFIFTLAQWEAQDEDHGTLRFPTAAPFGPDEIGRNARYVFALPPRFMAAEPDGVEEVRKLVAGNPLHAF